MAMSNTELATLGTRDVIGREAVGERQYLTFNLAGEQYGINILKVQEIKGWTPVTQMPNVPTFVRGVMNLRGAIVPVIDLRRRFGLEEVEHTKTTVVIVVMMKSESDERVIGMVVDGVSDVLNVGAADIQPPPDFGATVHTEFISGLVATDSGMIMLLDVDRLLSVKELFTLETYRIAEHI